MKFIVIGDIHFKIQNEEDTQQLTQFVVDTLEHEHIDKIIILGDVLHTHERLHTMVMNRAISMFTEFAKKAPLYVLVGNHDYINNSQYLSKQHWMTCIHYIPNIHIVDSLTCISKELAIYAIPYVPKGMMKKTIESVHPLHLLFAHQEIRGCKLGAIISQDGDEWDREGLLLSGHIHETQWVNNNVYYVGSSLQHSLSDKTPKQICIVDATQPTKIDIRNIAVPIHTRKIKYINETTWNTEDLKDLTYRDKLVLQCSKNDFRLIKQSKLYKNLRKQNISITWKEKINIITHTDTHNQSFEIRLQQKIKQHPQSTELNQLYQLLTQNLTLLT